MQMGGTKKWKMKNFPLFSESITLEVWLTKIQLKGMIPLTAVILDLFSKAQHVK